jgi:hypothetical protein
MGTAIAIPSKRPPTPKAKSIPRGAAPDFAGLRRLSGIILGNTSRMALAAGAKLSRIFGTASRSACAVGLRLSPALWTASRSAPAATPPHAVGSFKADSRSRGKDLSVSGSAGTPDDALSRAEAAGRCGLSGVRSEAAWASTNGAGGVGWLDAGGAAWLGSGTAGWFGAGPGCREIGGGGGFETRIDVGAGAAMSGDESSISRAPLTSSTSGAVGRLEVAGCACAAGMGSRESGLGGAGSSAPFPSVVSRLAGVANFGSLS